MTCIRIRWEWSKFKTYVRQSVVMSQFVPFATDNLYDVAMIRVLLKVDQDPCAHIQTLSHTCMLNTHVYMHTLWCVRTPICLGMRMHTQDIALAQHMHSHVFSSVHCTHTAHTHWYALTCILISASLTHSTCMPICTQMYSHQCIAHTQHVHADKHAHVFSSVHCTHTCMPTDTRFLWKDILFYNQMK